MIRIAEPRAVAPGLLLATSLGLFAFVLRDNVPVRGAPAVAALEDVTRTSPAYSPDGTRILTATLTSKPRVWSAKTGRLELELEGHTDAATSGEWSPDGSQIATGSADHTAKIWDAATGMLLFDLGDHEASIDVRYSADSSALLTTTNHERRIYDAKTGRLRFALDAIITVQTARRSSRFGGNAALIHAVDTTPDVITTSHDRTAKVWDADTGRLVASY